MDGGPEKLLDTLGDPEARRVLAALRRAPAPAKELADRLDCSLPTVYRRLDELESHRLVASRQAVDGGGNHYRVFNCVFEAAVVALGDDGYELHRVDETVLSEERAGERPVME